MVKLSDVEMEPFSNC